MPSPKSVVLYARLSVTTEESVSIARQLESARRYCAARDWKVVAEYVDDGISASKVKPEDRPGWRELMSNANKFEAVVVWKIDRLARKVLDFLHADEALQARGAGIVAVEDPVDMTTPQGRAFATMLAVFGEMEAAATSSRVRAARDSIVRSGRRPGGRPPFGWRNTPNPLGPGMILEQDPDRIEVVRELADRALAGASLYSLSRWLTDEGINPRARRSAGSGSGSDPVQARWHDASVEAILRAPALAGMTPYRGDVLRGVDGLPMVDESIAIITPAERRELLAQLDSAKRPGSRRSAGKEPALLYGIVRCGSCDGLLYRATSAKKYRQYRCQQKVCPAPVGVARDALEAFVTTSLLEHAGSRTVIEVESVYRDDKVRLTEIEAAIHETLDALNADGADVEALVERLAALKKARAAARSDGEERSPTFRATGQTLAAAWRAANSIEEQRKLLLDFVSLVRINPGGGRGRAFDPARVRIEWAADRSAKERYIEDVLTMRAWAHKERS